MVLKNLFTGQQWRNRHREWSYGHGKRGAEGEIYGKSNMETYITICKFPCYSLHTSHPLLPSPHGHKSILYVCFSIAGL